ncbi:hypothetical protein Pelo_15785 [Pelomyxa schiedti]|nr:hypothetical protein Pelo_15785 [Pelomyxa schiedti]
MVENRPPVVLDDVDPAATTVADLRAVVARRSGLPSADAVGVWLGPRVLQDPQQSLLLAASLLPPCPSSPSSSSSSSWGGGGTLHLVARVGPITPRTSSEAPRAVLGGGGGGGGGIMGRPVGGAPSFTNTITGTPLSNTFPSRTVTTNATEMSGSSSTTNAYRGMEYGSCEPDYSASSSSSCFSTPYSTSASSRSLFFSTCPSTVSLGTQLPVNSGPVDISVTTQMLPDVRSTPSHCTPVQGQSHTVSNLVDFWQVICQNRVSVPWVEFSEKFHQVFQMDIRACCFNVCRSSEASITCEKWEKLCRYWSNYENIGIDKESIEIWKSAEWFYGFMGKEESQRVLKSHAPKNLIIVRCSDSQPPLYTADISSDGRIQRVRIARQSESERGYWFQDASTGQVMYRNQDGSSQPLTAQQQQEQHRTGNLWYLINEESMLEHTMRVAQPTLLHLVLRVLQPSVNANPLPHRIPSFNKTP